MVKRLSFKGEKRSKKQSKPKSELALSFISGTSLVNEQTARFPLNGAQLTLSEINIEVVNDGWTTMLSSDLLNIQSDGIPLVFVCLRGKGPLALTVNKRIDEEKNECDTLVATTDELTVASEENTVIYSDIKDAINFKPNRVEPKSVSEIFYISDVTYLSQAKDSMMITDESSKQISNRYFTIKTNDGKYLTHDPEKHILTTTMAITPNSMFRLEPSQTHSLQFNICCYSSDKTKVMVTPNGKVTVINDEENILSDLCPFTLRIKSDDSKLANQINNSYRNNSIKPDCSNNRYEQILKEKLFELKKLNIIVNNKTIKTLKEAINTGNVGEWMIHIKEKKYGDRRA